MVTEYKVGNVHKLVETLLELTKEGYTYVPESVKQLGTRFRFSVEKIDLSIPDEISDIGQEIQPEVEDVKEEKPKKPSKPRAKKATTKK